MPAAVLALSITGRCSSGSGVADGLRALRAVRATGGDTAGFTAEIRATRALPLARQVHALAARAVASAPGQAAPSVGCYGPRMGSPPRSSSASTSSPDSSSQPPS
jgi:hypothetical protein